MKKKLFLACHLTLSILMALSAAPVNAGLLPQDGEAQYELEFWQSIQNSTAAEDYEAYLEAYPDGKFAPLARVRAARYKKAEPAETPPKQPKISVLDAFYESVSDTNVRREPSSQADKIGVLPRGSRVHVTGRVDDRPWYRIRMANNVTAYVYADLLRKPPARPETSPAPAAHSPPARAQAAPVTAPASGSDTQAALKTLKDCPTCPELVVLPPGRFIMGDAKGDRSERPPHSVAIKDAFAIGKHEVTVDQWNACVSAGGCSHALPGGLKGNSPVRDISWNDAQQYVRWLSKTTGKHYRLPTEAEWEYAARGGTRTRYWWGDDLGTGKANCKNCGGAWDHDTPVDVDALPANSFGLHGTSGGVWEWVADCWHRSYDGAPADGSAWGKADCREYVIRGGAWRNDSTYVHSASRFKYDAFVRYLLNGLRVARTP